MTSNQKAAAVETAYQLKRDFKFHLNADVDLSVLLEGIERGYAKEVEAHLNSLRVLYADQIKTQSNAVHC